MSALPLIPQDCPICHDEHDDAVHEAVLRIRRWLKRKVSLALRPVKAGKKGNGKGSPGGKPRHRKFGQTNKEAGIA